MREEDIWARAPHRRPRSEIFDMKRGIGDFTPRPINTPAEVPILRNPDPTQMYFWCPISANNTMNHGTNTVNMWMKKGWEPVKSIEHPELSYIAPSERETLNLIASETNMIEPFKNLPEKEFSHQRAFIYWKDCILMKCNKELVNDRLDEIKKRSDHAVHMANPEGFNSVKQPHNQTMKRESPVDEIYAY